MDAPASILREFDKLESIATEEDIFELACEIPDIDQANAFHDVFLLLRAGDVIGAKNRIDLYSNQLTLVETLPKAVTAELTAGDSFIDLQHLDPGIIEHFIKSKSFQDWMLYMHPEQQKLVERNFNGPARLSGVSGSGKTCVVVRRAIHLAQKYPGEQVLVLTLNKALAKLINDLIEYACHANRKNIEVKSFWEFCQEQLKQLEPLNDKAYDDITWKTNEHITDIWSEYYQCEANNDDAAVLIPVHQSLLSRNVFPKDYLRQEFDYVRSAVPVEKRSDYLGMEREGRALSFERSFRSQILKGLHSWEAKMAFVGVTDYLGLSSALHRHLSEIKPQYRCVLVDEVQDFGTIELEIVRKLAPEQENDIFLCGDIAQQVYTKHHKPLIAGLNITGRSHVIRRNYRNSREILDAAFTVLTQNLATGATKNVDFEVLEPEYSNFSTPKPLLLSADMLSEEFGSAFNYLQAQDTRLKMCIVICGYGLKDVKEIGAALNLQVLDGTTNIDNGHVFLSDLEQAKGFEFDSVCIVNCAHRVIPDPDLPSEESYRELSKLYVAMTRAKRELILSYSGTTSAFLANAVDKFTHGKWSEHAPQRQIEQFVFPDVVAIQRTKETWNGRQLVDLTGEEFIYTRAAIGVSVELQNKLLEHITGIDKAIDGRQVQWKTINHALYFPRQDYLTRLFGPETYKRFRELFLGAARSQ